MTSPLVEVKCFRCGCVCLSCICAPCPFCEPGICTTCPLNLEAIALRYGAKITVAQRPDTLVIYRSRDCPIPKRSGPQPIPKNQPSETISIVPEIGFDRGYYKSEELIWDDARIVAGALKTIFGFAAAGVVAASCAVVLAAAAVFSGEHPNDP